VAPLAGGLAGWRLACRITTTNDLQLDVPPLQTRPKAATVGVGRQVILRPSIIKRYLQLEDATLSDQRTDIQRIYDAIDDLELHTTITVLRTLGKTLRSSNFKVTAVIADDELIAIEPGDTPPAALPSPSTSAPPPWSPTCSTSTPARPSRSAACSTSSSPSAPT